MNSSQNTHIKQVSIIYKESSWKVEAQDAHAIYVSICKKGFDVFLKMLEDCISEGL
jgi:hypothetical protein